MHEIRAIAAKAKTKVWTLKGQQSKQSLQWHSWRLNLIKDLTFAYPLSLSRQQQGRGIPLHIDPRGFTFHHGKPSHTLWKNLVTGSVTPKPSHFSPKMAKQKDQFFRQHLQNQALLPPPRGRTVSYFLKTTHKSHSPTGGGAKQWYSPWWG